MAIEYSLTTAEAGRIIKQKLIRGELKYSELSSNEWYALLELGTYQLFDQNKLNK